MAHKKRRTNARRPPSQAIVPVPSPLLKLSHDTMALVCDIVAVTADIRR